MQCGLMFGVTIVISPLLALMVPELDHVGEVC